MKIFNRNPMDVLNKRNCLLPPKSSVPRIFTRQCRLCGEYFRTQEPASRSCAPCRAESELYHLAQAFSSEE